MDARDELERLQVLLDEALLASLWADLDLGLTLVATAKVELELGDIAGAAQSKQRALSAVRTVQQCKGRVPPRDKPEIEKRLSDLESLFSALGF